MKQKIHKKRKIHSFALKTNIFLLIKDGMKAVKWNIPSTFVG
jgi:hypothetical protein